MSSDQRGISENQITFYRVAGHSHNGEDSSRIDFSTYDILDVIDMGQLQSIIVNTVQNCVLTTNSITVGGGGSSIVIDGSTPATPSSLSVSSSASTISDGNIYIDASWAGDEDGSNTTYRVKLEKSDNGSAGTYYASQTAETSELAHRFEWIDNASGDGSTIYYKVSVYAISPLGVISTATTSSAIAPAVDSTAPARPVFNNTLSGFDEGVNPTFKGFFVQLVDNSEFDVKDGRGQYEFQVSISNNPLNGAEQFDDSSNMKASGSSKSNFFLVNNLDVRASTGASKTDYYLRVRARDSSGNTSPWTYYRNLNDSGSSGTGTTDITLASAINVLEVTGNVDILAGSITATEIAANTITAANIAAGIITGTEISAGVIEVAETLSSANYDNTSDPRTGWQIASNGSVTFNDITARGSIYANSGQIGSGADTWTIGAGTMQANTGASSLILSAAGTVPYIRMGSKSAYDDANAGVWIDPTHGIVLGSGTTGFWAKPDGTFYLGGTSGSVQWDGSTFSVSGDITGGTIDIGTESFHVDSEGNMWLGHSTYASAPFKVSKSGSLTATTGTYSGALSAATGTFAGSLSAATGTFAGSLSAAAGTFTGSLTAATGTFAGNSTSRIKFDTTAESGGSAIRFGTTSDDDAYGYLLYGSAITGGGGGVSDSGLSLKSGSGSGYVTVSETGSENVYIHSDEILTLSSGSTEASQYVKVDHKLEVNGTLRAKGVLRAEDNVDFGPTSSGFTRSSEQYLQVANTAGTAGIVVATGDSSSGYFRFGRSSDNSRIGISGSQLYGTLHFRANGLEQAYFNSVGLMPYSDGTKNIGSSSLAWDTIYADNGTIQSSDVNRKTDIQDATLGLDFIKALRPVQFKWKETAGRAGVRIHNGLIAQEVKDVLGGAASDTALWISDTDEEETRPSGDDLSPEDNPNHGATTEGIRYTELIGPIVKAIQEMEARLSALES